MSAADQAGDNIAITPVSIEAASTTHPPKRALLFDHTLDQIRTVRRSPMAFNSLCLDNAPCYVYHRLCSVQFSEEIQRSGP
jgi:hypothetical protein